VDDAFLLLEGMCGFRPEPAPKPRIVVPKGYFLEDCDSRIVDLVSAVAPVERVDLGDVQKIWEANGVILLSDAASVHENRLRDHPDWFGESVGPRLRNGMAHRGVDYARARDVQREWTARLERILGKETVLAVPSTPAPATIIGDREGPALSRLMTRFTSPFNLAGVPVLCVPIGRVEGLPVGLQLVAGAGQESLLKAAAASIRLPSL
jgi:aspartyl-tRNA(Asn)/glutamyl-tRNA(Gln) amidotransferase subunit A